jgi:hypothetical protein
MEKSITIALMVAAAALTVGAVSSRFDAVLGEVFGYGGLLIAVVCGLCVAGIWAIGEIEKERSR